jgi:hypothetical protein
MSLTRWERFRDKLDWLVPIVFLAGLVLFFLSAVVVFLWPEIVSRAVSRP